MKKPVLLVIDELPILLKRMFQHDGDATRVDEFLSWLRGAVQKITNQSLVLILSGSIGLEPLVRKLDISDRVNYLDPFRLRPWERKTTIECITKLADTYGLTVEPGVGDAIYDLLGVGIPHHVQSFFARLRENAILQGRNSLLVNDVTNVYQNSLLGPSGQNDLIHYESRLKEAMDDEGFRIAMEILAEAAIDGNFTLFKERTLATIYGELFERASEKITDVLSVLVHDGYLTANEDGYDFSSHLLKDWWAARFRGHHVALHDRLEDLGIQQTE